MMLLASLRDAENLALRESANMIDGPLTFFNVERSALFLFGLLIAFGAVSSISTFIARRQESQN